MGVIHVKLEHGLQLEWWESLGMCMVKYKSVVCFVVFILMFSWFMDTCFAADKAAADEALIDAENDLVSAYVAVAEAEQVGVNASELLAELKFAGNLLANAYNTYRVGDYDKAYSYAMNCSDRVNGIASEAAGLKLEAEKAYSERLFATAAVSSAGLSLLFVLSLFSWRFLKRRYFERILGMKPEVGKTE